MSVSRRQFIRYAGAGALALLNRPSGAAEAEFPIRRGPPGGPDFFRPIAPSREDRLVVPEGYRAEVVIAWGDPLGTGGPFGPEAFGFNNDFIAYFPIDALSGGRESSEGLLWVNHEYPNGLFISGHAVGRKSAEQVRAEKLAVGGTVVHVRREGGAWKPVVGSKYNRRLTALYPEIPLTGPAADRVSSGLGTLANCSGGRTPWFTALSCEENFPDFAPGGVHRWHEADMAIDPDQYGWVVEVDPFGELPPVKHSALGKFCHENAAVWVAPSGRLVVYMGDDAEDEHLYKFVSGGRYDPAAGRAGCRKLLESGTLYAADFAKGRWLPLDVARSPRLKAAGFADQADVLMRTREAAKLLGATPLDRCEDCEVNPLDGSVYVAMTNNARHGNFFGQIVRLTEDGGQSCDESFRYEVFLAGGPQSGLACPDNLAFDRRGRLWVVCDVSSGTAGTGQFAPFGNNGVYVVPTDGEAAGDAFQFASGPVECEVTGPCFTEDEKTLFLSVQHPGEATKSLEEPTSRWPSGDGLPRPAVVAVQGF